MNKKDYLRPTMKIIHLRHRMMLLSGSFCDMGGGGILGNSWTNNGNNAWGGSSPGGNSMGGWSDKGGSAW